MAKKRNCRRNDAEKEQHEFATKIRKMTDEQIFAAWGLRVQDGLVVSPKYDIALLRRFVAEIEYTTGFGPITKKKIRKVLNDWELLADAGENDL